MATWKNTGAIEERLRDAMWRADEGQWARIPGKSQIGILERQWAQMGCARVLLRRVSQARQAGAAVVCNLRSNEAAGVQPGTVKTTSGWNSFGQTSDFCTWRLKTITFTISFATMQREKRATYARCLESHLVASFVRRSSHRELI
jgi:hypothetical protein